MQTLFTSHQNLEQESSIPSSLKALPSNAHWFFCGTLLQKIWGNVPNDGKVFCCMAYPFTASIFIKSHIQNVVERVVSRPGEFHPQPLAEPDVNLSIHPAPIKQTHLSSLASSERRDPAAFPRLIPYSVQRSFSCFSKSLIDCSSTPADPALVLTTNLWITTLQRRLNHFLFDLILQELWLQGISIFDIVRSMCTGVCFQKISSAGGNIALRLMFFLSLCFLGLGTGCGDSRQAIVIAGSTSVQPLMEKIVEKYRKEHPELKLNVEGGGSGAGIMAVFTGTARLGMSSRELKASDEKEKTLTPIKIAYDAIIMVVHNDNPVTNLSLEQIRGLFAGKIRSWKEVGGPDRPVHLIIREEGSGTRSAFDDLVMKEGKIDIEIDPFALVQDSMGGVREVVKNDPDAIGFISMGGISKEVKVVKVNQIDPTLETVKSHQYTLIRPFLLLSKGPLDTIGKDLVDFVLSPAGGKIMQEEGCVSAGQ